MLSPFTVQSERDTGYQAASTLAGTRLNTPVKDIGASISIYTKDFLNDIGATNANDLLVFATGMEAGGPGGNFSGTNVSIGETQVVGDGPRVDPQSGSRTRGLSAPGFTRNFFLTNIAIDSYNTSAVTVNRGPNAILFGIGSPAGVVDTTLIMPDLNRDRNKVEHRFGDNNSHRFSVDFNRVLIPKKLALRIAALDDQERYDQRPAFENKKRLFGTATYRPFRSTAIKANVEVGNTRANRPITILPFDSINEFWYAAGRPTLDWAFYDDPARNANAATESAGLFRHGSIGQAQIFGGIVIPFPGRGSGIAEPSFRSVTSAGNGLNQLRTGLIHPLLNRDLAVDTIQFNETFNIGETNLAASLFPGGVRPAGVKMQGFTNYDAFPWNKRQIDETSRQTDDFRSFNVSIEQSGWKDARGVDRVGIELAYNKEVFRRYSNNAFFSQGNGNHIRVDVNPTLPDGRPNPNVGRPYAMGASAAQLNYFDAERENRRATGYLRHDFKDIAPKAGQWLGRHTLTGLYEEYGVMQMNSSTKLRMAGQTAEAIGAVITNFNRLPNALAYLGEPIHTGAPLKLEAIKINPLRDGLTTPTSWFQAPATPAGTTPVQGSLVTSESTVVEVFNFARPRRNLVKSQAVILQSYWLKDHLITTGGWRRDDDYTIGSAATDPTFLGNPTRLRYTLDEFGYPYEPPFNAGGEIKSYSVVLRWPKGLVRLPKGTDASVFFNDSQNFTPDSSRITAENVPIAPPKGVTKEYGLSLSLFNDKLNLRVNRFETSVVNQTFNPGVYGTAHNNAIRQVAGWWNLQVNQTGNFDRSADARELLDAVPGYRDLLGMQVTTNPTTGLVSTSENAIPALSDTTDFVAKGLELEIVYNPTRNWRMAFNLAKQETVQSNMAPATRSLIEKAMPVWNRYRDTPRANVNDWGGPTVPYPTTSAEHFGNFITNNVLVPYATLLAQEGQVSAEQRKWRANFVTNYTFDRTGRLKGFGIGTGVRWQDKYALGYPTSLNPDGSVKVDIKNPYWGDDELNVDAWISYGRKIYGDRINWRVQLNVRNVIADDAPIAITVQPDGRVATTRIPPEQRIYLTNVFEF